MPLDHSARNINSCKNYLSSFALSKLKDVAFPLSNMGCNTSTLNTYNLKKNLLVSLNVNNSESTVTKCGIHSWGNLIWKQNTWKGNQPSNPRLSLLSSSRRWSPDMPISWREKATKQMPRTCMVVSSAVNSGCTSCEHYTYITYTTLFWEVVDVIN